MNLISKIGAFVEAQIRPRSGLALKKGITVLNSPGTIDADYRGALTGAAVTLTEVYKYAHMDSRTLQMVTDAMDEAESTLQLTDPH